MNFTVNQAIIPLLGKRMYQRLSVAIIRELIQNSLDAGANMLRISILDNYKENFSSIIFEDNGIGIRDLKILFELGGSDKPLDNSVGGFGVAKFVLFAANSFTLETVSGRVHWNGKEVITSSSPSKENGTYIHAVYEYMWDFREVVYSYLSILKTLKPELVIYLDENQIQPKPCEMIYINNVPVYKMTGIPSTHRIWVALNSMPQMYTYVEDGEAVYIWDRQLKDNITPYDDNYPLSTTRETLTLQEDRETLQKITAGINDAVRERKEQERVRMEKTYTVIAHGEQIKYLGDSVKPLNQKQVRVFKQLKKLLLEYAECLGYKIEDIGITENQQMRGAYIEDFNTIYLNVSLESQEILATFLHEVAHTYQGEHNEAFASYFTRVIEKALNVYAPQFKVNAVQNKIIKILGNRYSLDDHGFISQ